MKALIAGWRAVWGDDDLAFYFVQLAPFRYNGSASALPEIWEAQTATLEVPHTGMAVTTDIGNINDIHPTNKQEVGRRLALWALAQTYGKSNLVYSGPLYDSMEVEIDTIRLKFKHGEGLKSNDGNALDWFQVAGEDHKFVPAVAEIDGDTIIVSSSKVADPVAVRFACDQLAEPNLVNGAGLPASPFRTDRWGTEPLAFPEKK
jgi:sialate O-acetylesterase